MRVGWGPHLDLHSSTRADFRYRLLRVGAPLLQVRTKIPLLQALGAASLSSPGAWAGARRGRGKPIGGEARCGGAHRRAWVRVRAHPRPWQRVPRRHPPGRHRAHLEIALESRVEP
eukprot:scaffold3731_cov63-Phaeocystis_antarctica.AAC.1